VIGGGPAGSTAAALLASWGRSVVLVDHESDQPSLAESLPSSARKLLAFLGELEVVDAAAFHPNDGNISRWAGKDASAATADRGYHIPRARFDRVLRDHAASCGATVANALVNHVTISEHVTVECTASGGPVRYKSSFVLDCSGRAGVIARRGLRRIDRGSRSRPNGTVPSGRNGNVPIRSSRATRTAGPGRCRCRQRGGNAR
jgi:FADH2-dependent halogenase/halogenation protein CepH